jgi:hypothetical protein
VDRKQDQAGSQQCAENLVDFERIHRARAPRRERWALHN